MEKTLSVVVREREFTDAKTGKTIKFNTLVLTDIPTALGNIEVELKASNDRSKIYLNDYLKLIKKGE
jgi:hypothetical protein